MLRFPEWQEMKMEVRKVGVVESALWWWTAGVGVTAVDSGGSRFRCVVSFSRKKTASSLAFVSNDATTTFQEKAIIVPAVGCNSKHLQWMLSPESGFQPDILILVGSSVFVLTVIVTIFCLVTTDHHRCRRTSERYKPMQKLQLHARLIYLSVSAINTDSIKLSVESAESLTKGSPYGLGVVMLAIVTVCLPMPVSCYRLDVFRSIFCSL
jgi:hypothetical protein